MGIDHRAALGLLVGLSIPTFPRTLCLEWQMPNRVRSGVVSCTVILALSSGVRADNASRLRPYELVDLFSVGGGAVGAEALNEEGVVTVRSIQGLHAVDAWSGSERLLDACHRCYAPAINSSGDIAGYQGSGRTWTGFVLRAGNKSVVPPFPGGQDVFVYGMNDSGWVVGGAGSADSYARAFVFRDGLIEDLGFGGALSFAMAVNRHGLIVGFSVDPDGGQHAVRWRKGLTTPIGRATPWNSRAVAVNDKGTAVGYIWPPPSEPYVFHAVRFVDGDVQDLGTLPGMPHSQATAVNRHGLIVGGSMTESYQWRAFLYAAGHMTDLNDLVRATNGIVIQRATGINSDGVIIAEGIGVDGAQHALVLRPTGRSEDE
jgi:probable HAF family extracellular repeat protein